MATYLYKCMNRYSLLLLRKQYYSAFFLKFWGMRIYRKRFIGNLDHGITHVLFYVYSKCSGELPIAVFLVNFLYVHLKMKTFLYGNSSDEATVYDRISLQWTLVINQYNSWKWRRTRKTERKNKRDREESREKT